MMLHLDYGKRMEEQGIIEELFMHEGAHVSLDGDHKKVCILITYFYFFSTSINFLNLIFFKHAKWIHSSIFIDYFKEPDYICAQNLDRKYISQYAKDNPGREDISESSIMWFAARYKKDRQDPKLLEDVEAHIPNRMRYYEAKLKLVLPE